jgi:MFS family permease
MSELPTASLRDTAEVISAAPAASATQPKARNLLAKRDFRLLWLGQSISLLGDQFYLIALPWLALKLTGSGLALGTVLAVAGIPRAIFMLVGGALTDRFSPRRIMLISDFTRILLTAALTALVLFDAAQFWMLYLFAIAFGIVDAFFHPAYMAMLPRMIDEDELQAGNAILQGTGQLMSFVGPGPAGLMISTFERSVGVVAAVGVAFGVDTLTFIISWLALLLMSTGRHIGVLNAAPGSADAPEHKNMLASIKEGLVAVRDDSVLPTMLLITAAVNFLFIGPMTVGVATLANQRFVEGAAALGTIMSAMGGGALLGVVLGGMLKPKRLGVVILLALAVSDVGLAVLGLSANLLLAAIVAAIIGIIIGFVNVLMIAWMQRRVSPDLMGRVMSLVMLASLGLAPLSQALAGALVDISVTGLFVGAGVLLFIVTLIAANNKAMRDMRG